MSAELTAADIRRLFASAADADGIPRTCPFGHSMWWWAERNGPEESVRRRWGICDSSQARCRYVWMVLSNSSCPLLKVGTSWVQVEHYNPAQLVARLREFAELLGYY
jgi:hypothetical protein